MSRVRFELATEHDDADLRHVLAATPMEGTVSVSFRREPRFFAAAPVDGRSVQVVACRDGDSGRIVGFGCRCLRELYVNGAPTPVGYLSSLRLLREHRRRGLVARGYAYFRRLHGDGKAALYLTTIAEGNRTALDTLTSGRAGLPAYHPAGSYHTLAVPLRRVREDTKGLTIRPAKEADVPAVVAYLNEFGPRRQFFPVYRADDFFTPSGALLGLRPEGLLLAFDGGRLVGTLAAWDQHALKQSVVEGYTGALRWLRPAVNLWGRLRGLPPLPRPGEAMRYLTGALPVVAGDRPEVFGALIRSLVARSAGGANGHLMLGLHEADPLVGVARAWSAACFTTRLFLVCWDDGEETRRRLDGRPPYLELGAL